MTRYLGSYVMTDDKSQMAKRFRGYLPVVIDIETAGFNPNRNPLLEIAASITTMDDDGLIHADDCLHYHVLPFKNAELDQAALDFTGIDPYHPFRMAIDEDKAIRHIFKAVRQALKDQGCQRAILVGHNPAFDLSFINAIVKRHHLKRNPLHPFSTFDTATLGGLAFGQTVLARACIAANIDFDRDEAHSALYDTQKTAELFCTIVNQWHHLGGWPL